MGLLADFVVAGLSDAQEYASRSGNIARLEQRVSRSEWKNYTNLSLGILWAILRGETFDIKRHDLEVISIASNHESWLFRFPPDLVDRLASLEEAQIARLAASWAESEEVPGRGADNEPVLLELRRLARAAKTQNRSLFLFGSL
ncbi:MAG: hypothetical protein ACLPX9_13575 [Rhodomicrobium sp.]